MALEISNESFFANMVQICNIASNSENDTQIAGNSVYDAVMERWPNINSAHTNFTKLRARLDERFHPFLRLSEEDMQARNVANQETVHAAHNSVKVIDLESYCKVMENLNVKNPTL
jgi:hypothetical protein